MLDSGSVTCALSTAIFPELLEQEVLKTPTLEPIDVVLIGCGGSKTIPSGVCDLEVEVCGYKAIVPTLVVEGQNDSLIIGSNLLRYLIHHLALQRGILSSDSTKFESASDSWKWLMSWWLKREWSLRMFLRRLDVSKYRELSLLNP